MNMTMQDFDRLPSDRSAVPGVVIIPPPRPRTLVLAPDEFRAARLEGALAGAPHARPEIRSITAWANDLLRGRGHMYTYDHAAATRLLHEAWRTSAGPSRVTPADVEGCAFEIEKIIQFHGLTRPAQYLMHRDTRGLRTLPYATRGFVWRVLETYEYSKARVGLSDGHDVISMAIQSLLETPLDAQTRPVDVVCCDPGEWSQAARRLASLIGEPTVSARSRSLSAVS